MTVLICAYTEERWSDLIDSIESVKQQRYPAHEIVVVIDHNPLLFARLEERFPDDIILTTNREDKGLSGARNSGIAAARGEVIAFLDDDATAHPAWLQCLVRHYASKAVLGVGGAIDPLWLASRPAWFPDEFNWVVGCTYRGMPTGTAPVRNLLGANMSIRREVFETVGGFRTGIGRVGTRPVGCEETELCIRARQRWPDRYFLFDPEARVEHRVPAQRSRWRYFSSRCYAEGLSKALVARHVGATDGLSSERRHVLRTLPRGALAGVTQTATGRDPAGVQRAAAILAGLALTAAGYFAGTVLGRA